MRRFTIPSETQTCRPQEQRPAPGRPHWTCRIELSLPQPFLREDALSWRCGGDLEFAWIGRPRCIRDGGRAQGDELCLDLAQRWLHEGPSALANIRGGWALLVHDPRQRQLWAATDRFATVPILYRPHQGQRGLTISTDLAQLQRHAEAFPEINRQAALQFLTLRHVADQQHLVAGIRRVLPGSVLGVNYADDRVHLTEKTYFPRTSRERAEVPESADESVFIAQIRQAIAEELKDGWEFHRTAGSREIGLLYSGGIDSAFLAANLEDSQRSHLHLTTYGFDDRTADLEFAQASVRELGDLEERWTPLQVRPEQTPDLLDRIIRETSLPVEHPNFLARRQAYQHLAEQGVQTVVAGEGADTLLGGAWYVTMQKVLSLRQLAERFRIPRAAWNAAGWLNPSRRDLFRLVGEPDWRMVCVLAKAYVPFDWLSTTARSLGPWSADSFPYHTALLDRVGPQAKLEAIYELGLMANMSAELAAEQAMAQSCGMVQWNPFLDGRFPDRMASIPLALRTKGWRAKHLLYQAAQGSVPPTCLNRPKSGCPAPLMTWLSEPRALGGHVDALGHPQSFCSDLLGAQAVGAVVRRFRQNPNARDAEILWVLVGLERWNEIVLQDQTRQAKKAVPYA